PLLLPKECGAAGHARLVLEDGTEQDVMLEEVRNGHILPALDRTGYHHLVFSERSIGLAVAPPHCFRVEDASPGRRIWGPAVQIAALRDERESSFGDFGALAKAARAFAARGADAMAISPVHALFPADAGRYSPYAPSSRLFLNVFFADPSLLGHALKPSATAELIDWPSAIPERLAQLRIAYDSRNDGIRAAIAAYAERGGEELLRHAHFDALHAYFFRRDGSRGWQDWPAEYRDPAGSAVSVFAAEHEDEVGFYLFLQWLAEQGLNEAQRAARQAGMAIGLIADLAVGMDAGGSHAWSRPEELLTGLSIGAPPDPLGPEGQNWGITGFSPQALQHTGFDAFIATIRAALSHAGGIRIDHALGLRRLWVVPDGASPTEGAYLTYPLDDMLRLLALESERAKAIVIGEDLGTVPEGLREKLAARKLLGMRVLFFERDDNGTFKPLEEWPASAIATSTTHDLPTIEGWWKAHDIDWRIRVGQHREDERPAQLEERERERAGLLRLLREYAPSVKGDLADPDVLADACAVCLGRSPAPLVLFPVEDALGLLEQPNMPGIIDTHPNWRRRYPSDSATMLDDPACAHRLELLSSAREQAIGTKHR
ncbi:MAG: 4-alpha-glucanotransferase, partial [Alphaproteobacteria bacterium]|nr:4-alpha-glucanotransferase [Alphaproteobacteria bacterium]